MVKRQEDMNIYTLQYSDLLYIYVEIYSNSLCDWKGKNDDLLYLLQI